LVLVDIMLPSLSKNIKLKRNSFVENNKKK